MIFYFHLKNYIQVLKFDNVILIIDIFNLFTSELKAVYFVTLNFELQKMFNLFFFGIKRYQFKTISEISTLSTFLSSSYITSISFPYKSIKFS